jgi:hypothetical protein
MMLDLGRFRGKIRELLNTEEALAIWGPRSARIKGPHWDLEFDWDNKNLTWMLWGPVIIHPLDKEDVAVLSSMVKEEIERHIAAKTAKDAQAIWDTFGIK